MRKALIRPEETYISGSHMAASRQGQANVAGTGSGGRFAPWLPLMAGIAYGTAFPMISVAIGGFAPLSIAFWRAVIGTVSLGGWLLLTRSFSARPSLGSWVRLGIVALAGAGVFWPVQNYAVKLSTPVNVAFLVSIYPAIIAVAAPAILGERARRRNLLGLALALSGAYLVLSNGRFLSFFSAEGAAGDGLALVAALSFGSYVILGQLWREKMGVTPEELSFFTFALSLPVLGVVAVTQGPLVAQPGLASIGAVVWLGLVTSTAAFLALNAGIRRGAVARGSVHLLVIPLVSALVSWGFFRTTMSPIQWLGGALVLAGIAASSR